MITKSLGNYDFCSNKKEWCVAVLHPDGKWISEMWPEEDEPDIDGLAPSEVIDLIEERCKSWWISTGRPEKLARIAAFREVAAAQDDKWARGKIQFLQREIKQLQHYLIEVP